VSAKPAAGQAEETGDTKTWNLVTNQYEMYEAIEQIVAKGIAFDPASGLARTWHPSKNEHPNIIVDPRRAFGVPVVVGSGVPTSALFKLWKAEGGSKDRVAQWFNVARIDVDQAIDFELTLAAA
jgi:uncharacterized protein (DUF433 family)